ncbi:hypothetical protein F2Q69_00037263 [Brassica cretica]|uniref:Uncharacterized protein n=1 Tax=Brassica cretica TaxID=69181 RepID=A0A8S9SUR0_BRACR|nr:hypothetical protein F2Q69_00037263 [Brassica cretica]
MDHETKPLSRSLRSDRPSHSVGRYIATDPQMSRSLRSDRPANESVATKRPTKPLGRLLRSDRSTTSWSLLRERPSLSVGRYVATNPQSSRLLRSDRSIADPVVT